MYVRVCIIIELHPKLGIMSTQRKDLLKNHQCGILCWLVIFRNLFICILAVIMNMFKIKMYYCLSLSKKVLMKMN